MSKVLRELQEELAKERGYMPSIGEILGEYTDGMLNVTDEQEDELASLIQ